jgi:hypothetical protein
MVERYAHQSGSHLAAAMDTLEASYLSTKKPA